MGVDEMLRSLGGRGGSKSDATTSGKFNLAIV